MRFLPLFLALCVLFPSVGAEASFLDKLFGLTPKGEGTAPPPEKTLDAPFGKDEAPAPQTQRQKDLMAVYGKSERANEASLALDQPHRSPEQIGAWVAGAVATSLTITPQTWEKDSLRIADLFVPFGLREYKDYLNRTHLVESLTDRGMKLQAIADGSPFLAREAPLDGTYRWVFRVPLLLTFYGQEMKKIEKGQKLSAQSQKVVVDVQVGRLPLSAKEKALDSESVGVAIERWKISGGE